MNELDVMASLAKAFDALEEDERSRVLGWAISKYGSSTDTLFQQSAGPGTVTASSKDTAKPKAGAKKPKHPKKQKSVIPMDKTLDLAPKGKTSAIDFAKSKAPSNVMQKCVVATYYLRETIGMTAINVSAVLTYFKTLGWPVPNDLKNTLQQAGSKGWLDTADAEDIKITSMGENLIDHDLPPKLKA